MFEQHWVESDLNDGRGLMNQFVVSVIKAQWVMPQDQRNGGSFLVGGLGESALPVSLTVTPLSLPSPSLCHTLTKVICPRIIEGSVHFFCSDKIHQVNAL